MGGHSCLNVLERCPAQTALPSAGRGGRTQSEIKDNELTEPLYCLKSGFMPGSSIRVLYPDHLHPPQDQPFQQDIMSSPVHPEGSPIKQNTTQP